MFPVSDLPSDFHPLHNGLHLWYKILDENNRFMQLCNILAKLDLVSRDSAGNNGLFMIDKDLAARMTTVPTDFSKGIEAALKANP